MDLDQAIQQRHSVRKFSTKKPKWDEIIECIDSMRHAPMAGGNFTLKFILVEDLGKIKKLAEAAEQPFIGNAKFVLVVCSKIDRLVNAYGERGKRYAKQQAGAAIENFLLKIEEKGLATCWVGHFVDSIVKEILNIPEEVEVEALFPIGYELKRRYTRQLKIDLDNVLYFEKYGQKQKKVPKKLNV